MDTIRDPPHTTEQKKMATAVPVACDKSTTTAAAPADATERVAAADRQGKADEKLSTAQQIDRSFMIIHRSLDRLEHTFDRFERRLAARRRLLCLGGDGRGRGRGRG